MKVAVTGPAGYVGVSLVRLLVERGHHVVATDLQDFKRLAHSNLETVRADILDAAALRAALDDVEVVFHLAAMITMARHNDLAWRVNTRGVLCIAEAALQAGVRRMLHSSSLNAFDQRNQDGPVDEHTRRSTATDLPLYDRSKWQGECEFQSVIRRGLDGVIVNPTAILGPVACHRNHHRRPRAVLPAHRSPAPIAKRRVGHRRRRYVVRPQVTATPVRQPGWAGAAATSKTAARVVMPSNDHRESKPWA